jgi:hypothetical protein
MTRLAVTLAFLLVVFTVPTAVWAAGPTLTVSANGGVQIFDRDEYRRNHHVEKKPRGARKQ